MSEQQCARCSSFFRYDEAKAIDHVGHLYVFSGYCEGSGHRNYLIIDATSFDRIIIGMPSSIHSAVYLEHHEPEVIRHDLQQRKRAGDCLLELANKSSEKEKAGSK